MKIRWILLLLGLLAYIGSFFMTAVKDSTAAATAAGYPGYFCAAVTITSPWGHSGWGELQQDPVDFFAVLFSGWINPLFVITLAARLLRPQGRLSRVLLVILLVMFPACWVVFLKVHVHPVTGYYVWTAAMLVALFARTFTEGDREQAVARAA